MQTADSPQAARPVFKADTSRDIYWAQLNLPQQSASKVYIGASNEYLAEHFRKWDFTDAEANTWFQTIIQKWLNLGKSFKGSRFDVYGVTTEGAANIKEFLESEVKNSTN